MSLPRSPPRLAHPSPSQLPALQATAAIALPHSEEVPGLIYNRKSILLEGLNCYFYFSDTYIILIILSVSPLMALGSSCLSGNCSISSKYQMCRHRFLYYSFNLSRGFPGGSDGKEPACNAGDLDSVPEWGRSPGGGHGSPLQYSCLESAINKRNLPGYSMGSQRVGHD